jgi:nicotinate-nucleotide adenylyltransferase
VDDPRRLREAPGGLLYWVRVTQLDISATAIRDLLARGLSPRFLLPDAVLERIRERGLYR